MKQFQALKVVAKTPETRDSVRIALEVPDALRKDFTFIPGQHLPLQAEIGGRRLRRTYSICSAAGCFPLEIGVRVQPGGQFSEFAANELEVGAVLEAMPPTGRFHVSEGEADRVHAGFAAGSGITPVLSILRYVLEHEPGSRFALFYANRQQATTMFIDDLFALKNRFPDRLQLQFVFSREEQEFEIAAGRLDADKVVELCEKFLPRMTIDHAWVCGPDSMIDSVTQGLESHGVETAAIHAERFGAPRRATGAPSGVAAGDEGSMTTVTVIMDGHRKSFRMPRAGLNIVDAAAAEGIELPYSCKGGVCATCRTFLRDGEVQMAQNYGLEPWEVEQGFVLACQSTPLCDEVVLDYDKS